jgi:hypothetical protein
MSSMFCLTFSFTTHDLVQREALVRIKYFIFHRQPKETTPRVVCSYHHPVSKLKEAVRCCKIDMDNIDDEDPREIHIKESKGEHTIEGKMSDMNLLDYNGPIKTKKHNINSEEAPKMAIIGDYWDNETTT